MREWISFLSLYLQASLLSVGILCLSFGLDANPGNSPGLGEVGALNYGYSRGYSVRNVAPCYLVAFCQRQQL
jgi:hypothetical protein